MCAALFCHCLFLIPSSFCASGRLCFAIVLFSGLHIQRTLFIPTLGTTTKFVIMTIWLSRNLRLRRNNLSQIMQEYCIWYLHIFWIFVRIAQWGDSNKYPKHMYCEKIRINHGLYYISFRPLRILYKSKFIIMAISLGTNAVVVARVHCTCMSMSKIDYI